MSYLERLKSCSNLKEFAEYLGYKPSNLSYLLYVLNDDLKYRTFEISKKSKEARVIKAPEKSLKGLQRRLASRLENCQKEIESNLGIVNPVSHGFRKGHSIATNANIHKRKRYVFNLDIKDFFGTLDFGRVRGFFIKNYNYELAPEVATIIAQISCFDNSLPQGSPCSPIISNLIGNILDVKLLKLAKKNGCHYSRYADDLTFSTNQKVFPADIAIQDPIKGDWDCGAEIYKIMKLVRFQINDSKTRMLYRNSRQLVTGLVVNRKVNIAADYWRDTRAMLWNLFNTGSFFIKDNSEEVAEGTLSQLNGRLDFIYQIDAYNTNKSKGENVKTAKKEAYKKFLFFKSFYVNEMPTIVCEGKTDPIYLKCALESLADSHRELIDKDGKLNIGLFNYSKVAADVLELSGGNAPISKFLDQYQKMFSLFRVNSSQNPTIIILDNDGAGLRTLNHAKRGATSEVKMDGFDEPIQCLPENIYVFRIPRIIDKDLEIEDYFKEEAFQIKLNEKSFKRKGVIDKKKEFGKFLFAEKIVKNNKKNIDFSQFSLIFNVIQQIISHSKASAPTD
ncbi:retron Ec67 family RNA-directed DNA polymerase/endonuclease [Aliikangiella sp. G2MR2-5]|uniref:retron Ec67 family RNA-directed DNA polymerase/endonuclease n=1 Tax=Aliikangiella sp. G2MR2-5 TaxID=2788943 RepID=UPI0018A959FD|nr:retron Ec67 family RNA-directed DNA polymerase/endonuclease [Aliikangiella sp. G2MR2-5]